VRRSEIDRLRSMVPAGDYCIFSFWLDLSDGAGAYPAYETGLEKRLPPGISQ